LPLLKFQPSYNNNNHINNNVAILWNEQVNTDRIVPSNKLGTIIRDGDKGTYMLIYVASLGDRTVSSKTPKIF